MNKEKDYLLKIIRLSKLLCSSRYRAIILSLLSEDIDDKARFNKIYSHISDSISLLDLILDDLDKKYRY